MPRADDERRFRAPPSFSLWVGTALPLAVFAGVLTKILTQDNILANALGAFVLVCCTRLYEQRLELELKLEGIKKHWGDKKNNIVTFNRKTIDHIWSNTECQRAFKACAYQVDTNNFVNRYKAVNSIAFFTTGAVVVGALLSRDDIASTSLRAILDAPPRNNDTIENLALLPLLIPLFVMWGPAFHLVPRNNDLMDS